MKRDKGRDRQRMTSQRHTGKKKKERENDRPTLYIIVAHDILVLSITIQELSSFTAFK